MTPLPPVPKTIQFQLLYQITSGIPARNILYFSYTGLLNPSDLQTLCNNLMTQWGSHVGPQLTSSLQLQQVFGNDLSGPSAPQSASTIAAITGSSGGTSVPAGVAFVISNETSLKYKGGHSRVYIPCVAGVNMVDENTWTTNFQSALLTAWSTFINQFISAAVPAAVGALSQVVAHRYGRTPSGPGGPPDSELPSVPLTNPYTSPVVAWRTNPQTASQRRRNQQRF